MTQTPNLPAQSKPKKPLRFKIGVAFLVLCGLLYLSIAVTLFLPLDGGSKAAFVGATIVVAEACGLVGTAGVGKEVVRKVKALLGLKKRGRSRGKESVPGQ
ncbi:transporter suffix domain-containing protein [Amycolatopsis halotolerans]|uniref:Transporter suffix domain-containing protein n=1 Tax=Amycolatopsis halotolerans TaxID=330083 RepID=A0ABV7QDF0_9PSEU